MFKKKDKAAKQTEKEEELEEKVEEKVEEKEEAKLPKKLAPTGFVNSNRDEKVAEMVQVEKPSKKQTEKASGQVYFTIILVVFLVVNITAILLFVFDVGQIRTKFVALNNNSQSQAVANNSLNEKNLEEKKSLEDERKKITEIQATQAQKEEELNKLKQDLDAKEIEMARAAAVVPSPTPSPTPVASKTNFAEAVKIYESMEPSTAAKILSSVDMETKVSIIKAMKKATSAEILAQMDSKESASILSAIIKK